MKEFLCSHLVTLRFGHTETGGNLERIWSSGVTVNSEISVKPGTHLTVCASACELPGTVVSCDSDELGNFLDIALDAEWTLEIFQPDYLVDPSMVLPSLK